MAKKRGQDAAGAAALVALIAGLIILYILFLPPGERAALLGDNDSSSSSSSSTSGVHKQVLLSVNPGTLYQTKQQDFQHQLGTISLYVRTEDKVLASVESASISASNSKQKTKKIIVSVDSKNTRNAKLAFAVAKHSGNLIITLNDEEIFNSEVANGNVQPIKLQNLQDQNIVEFSVSEPGWMFWATNYYDLSGIIVTATVSDVSNREAAVSFFMDAEEANSIERASLMYYVSCQGQPGKLNTYLNDMILSSKIPDCQATEKIELSSDQLKQGANSVKFYIEKGSLMLDQVIIKTELTDPIYPVYYFEINQTQFSKIASDSLTATLSMKFPDDQERKVADLIINDHKTFIDTKESSYSRNINSFIDNYGTSYIKIQPRTTISVVELKVALD